MSVNSPVNDTTINELSVSYFDYLFNMIKDNLNYIIIGICILLISYTVYYIFFKSDSQLKKICKPLLQLPKNENINTSDIKEYIILDENGNPVKISNNFFNSLNIKNDNLLTNKLKNIKLNNNNNNKLNTDTEESQINIANKRKLLHPLTSNDINDIEENNISSEINYNLANINADENNNIKLQNLTNSEIEDINNKLNII